MLIDQGDTTDASTHTTTSKSRAEAARERTPRTAGSRVFPAAPPAPSSAAAGGAATSEAAGAAGARRRVSDCARYGRVHRLEVAGEKRRLEGAAADVPVVRGACVDTLECLRPQRDAAEHDGIREQLREDLRLLGKLLAVSLSRGHVKPEPECVLQ